MSQLGPAWMTLSLRCGCVYRTTSRLLWTAIREEGNYRTASGTLVFARPAGGDTRWPYRFEDGKLIIEESAGERHVYVKTTRRTCER